MMIARVWAPLVAAAVWLAAMAAYIPTLAPTISWRNGGADSGDLAAAVATLGIPHPPGYPGYVLLGFLWTSLPFGGDLAYRLNIMSAVGAALAASLGAFTVMLLGRQLRIGRLSLATGAAFGTLSFALAPLTWSQATIAEVYAPGMLPLALMSLIALTWRQRPSRVSLLVCGLVGGIGFGMLPQIVLVAPGVALAALAGVRPAAIVERLGLLVGGAAVGLTTFLYLPLRATAEPLVNWGNPSTPERFWAVVTAQMYHGLVSAPGPVDWLARVVESAVLVVHNIGLVGVVLGAAGASVFWASSRANFWYVLSLVVLTLAFRASYRAEGDAVYVLPALYGMSLLAGLGAAHLSYRLGNMLPSMVPVSTVALGVMLAWHASATMPAVDVSDDDGADRFSRATLSALPPDAVLVSERDETTFGLWYRQALGDRADVVVIDARLLSYPWYRGQLVSRYPDLDPAAVRPGGLTALARPVYVVAMNSREEVVRSAQYAAPGSLNRSPGNERFVRAVAE